MISRCPPLLKQMDQSENANLSLIAALQAKIASLSLENQQLAQIIKVTYCKKSFLFIKYCHDKQVLQCIAMSNSQWPEFGSVLPVFILLVLPVFIWK